MSTPAFTITCGYAGSAASRDKSQRVLSKLVWQEAPSTGTKSTNTVPVVNDARGEALYRAHATADSWLSYGKNPDSAGTVRVLVPANLDCDFNPEPGDFFMWQAA